MDNRSLSDIRSQKCRGELTRERPVRQRLRAWHAVRVLSAPPRTPTFADISRLPASRAGRVACAGLSLQRRPSILRARFGLCLCPQCRLATRASFSYFPDSRKITEHLDKRAGQSIRIAVPLASERPRLSIVAIVELMAGKAQDCARCLRLFRRVRTIPMMRNVLAGAKPDAFLLARMASQPFRPLCLCPQNSVSRQRRLRFEESRFEFIARRNKNGP